MTTRLLSLAVLALLAASCATPSGARRAADSPRPPQESGPAVVLLPTPSWPVRWSVSPPVEAISAPVAGWVPPSLEEASVVSQKVRPIPDLPLPEVRTLPVKETPVSRSWTTVTQSKPPASLPTPTPIAATKAPSTVAAKPAPPPTTKAPAPTTAAATASLLPVEALNGADFRWQDVNAVAGDAVTLHFEKTNWIYLDSPAQQKTLGFQSISRDKDATTFQFRPLTPGHYTLEFQRQDLANQTAEVRKVSLTVVKPGTRTTGATLAPQTSTSANDALETARQLAAVGKTAEAVEKLLQSYKADDTRLNLALGRLLNQNGQADEALTYLDRNLTFTGPDLQGTLELGTRLAASRDPQKRLPSYVKLWSVGTLVPSEDLYLQVFDTLRAQKMATLLKDWSSRYASWYAAPRARDRYLYQLGQWLEEPGEQRDVRGSWRAYNEVVQSYPLSPYWKLAGERAAYINRHFLQVR